MTVIDALLMSSNQMSALKLLYNEKCHARVKFLICPLKRSVRLKLKACEASDLCWTLLMISALKSITYEADK